MVPEFCLNCVMCLAQSMSFEFLVKFECTVAFENRFVPRQYNYVGVPKLESKEIYASSEPLIRRVIEFQCILA